MEKNYTLEALKKIGLSKCIEALGMGFIRDAKNDCCEFYGMDAETNMFSYGIAGGYDGDINEVKPWSETPYKYRCIVLINLETGEAAFDKDNVLPQ